MTRIEEETERRFPITFTVKSASKGCAHLYFKQEAAISEFLDMRTRILGRISPEALRCVAAIFERHMEERKEKKNSRF
jgi:hypothetical protein